MRYHANIEPLKAEEMLASGKRFTSEGVRNLVYQATGNQRLADRACAEAVIQEQRDKTTE